MKMGNYLINQVIRVLDSCVTYRDMVGRIKELGLIIVDNN